MVIVPIGTATLPEPRINERFLFVDHQSHRFQVRDDLKGSFIRDDDIIAEYGEQWGGLKSDTEQDKGHQLESEPTAHRTDLVENIKVPIKAFEIWRARLGNQTHEPFGTEEFNEPHGNAITGIAKVDRRKRLVLDHLTVLHRETIKVDPKFILKDEPDPVSYPSLDTHNWHTFESDGPIHLIVLWNSGKTASLVHNCDGGQSTTKTQESTIPAPFVALPRFDMKLSNLLSVVAQFRS
jgi:hypothetical protein